MNKIIFTVTAFIGLACIANFSSIKPSKALFMKDALLAQESTKRKIPGQKPSPYREPFLAVEVTDEALEELRKISKLSKSALPVQIYHLE